MASPLGPKFLLSIQSIVQVICRYLICRCNHKPLNFLVPLTSKIINVLNFYPLVDWSPPELILPDLYCRPGSLHGLLACCLFHWVDIENLAKVQLSVALPYPPVIVPVRAIVRGYEQTVFNNRL